MKLHELSYKGYRIEEFSFFLCILCLPLNDATVTISFGLFLFLGIVIHFKNPNKKISVLIITLLFFVSLISLIYTKDYDSTLDKIFKNLIFLLVPLGFYFNKISLSTLKKGKILFVLSWTVFCVVSLSNIFISWLQNPIERNYYNFIQASMFHNYMPQDALYICAALVFLLFSLTSWNKYLRFFISIIFFSVLILYGVRLGILQFSTIILVYIIINRKKIINLKNVILFIAVMIFSSFLIVSNPYTKDKILSTLQSINVNVGENEVTEIAEDYHQINFRFQLWPLAVELFKEKPVLGYGGGTEQDLLYEMTQEKKYGLRKVHAHNQFLSFSIQYGIIGLSLLIFTLTYIFLKVDKNKEHLLLLFLIFSGMMTDSYFNVQQGMIFFTTFGSIILYFSKKTKKGSD